MDKVFISYRNADGKEIAEHIRKELDKSGFYAYIDDKLQSGQWDKQLEDAIIACPIFIPIITEGYIERLSTGTEGENNVIIREFLTALRAHGKKGIIPYYGNNTLLETANNVLVGAKEYGSLDSYESAKCGEYEKLIRLAAKVCPTQVMEVMEDLSEKYISSWRKAQEGVMFDYDSLILRVIDIGNKEYNCSLDSIKEILQAHKNLCIQGDGGCGKTFLLQQIFDVLRGDAHYSVVYIRLADVKFTHSSNEKQTDAIKTYIKDNRGDGYGMLFQEMQKEDADIPRVVFLLDGLNEAAGKQSIVYNEIVNLTRIAPYVIMTTRYLPSELTSVFTSARIKGLSDKEISNYLGVNSLSVADKSILRYPLYLRLYKLSGKAASYVDSEIIQCTKYSILSEVFIKHPIDKFGNDLVDELRVAYAFLIPFICFQMVNRNAMTISEDELLEYMDICCDCIPSDNGARARVESCFEFGRDLTIRTLIDAERRMLLKEILTQLYPRIDLYDEEVYRICHQDIRDFFAAHFIKSILLTVQKSGFRGKLNSFDALLGESLCMFDNCSDKSVRPDKGAVPMIVQGLGGGDCPQFPFDIVNGNSVLVDALARVLCFLVDTEIENTHNASPEKVKICSKFEKALEMACNYMLDNNLITTVNNESVAKYDLIVRYMEVLRRLGSYEKSLELSLRFNEFDDKQIRRSKNNAAKCKLYRAVEIAQYHKKNYSPEAEQLYREAISLLKENIEYELSANLYSMLLAYPDPVSAKYLSTILGTDMNKRRFEAYNTECAVVKNAEGMYSLLTVLSYLLHGYVRIIGTDTLLPHVVATDSEECRDIRLDMPAIMDSVKSIMDVLDSSKEIVKCFSGLIKLRDDELFVEAMTDFKLSFSNNSKGEITGSLLGCFVYSLLNPEWSFTERINWMESIKSTFLKKLDRHSVDNFDSMYILEDLKTAWNGIKKRYGGEIINELIEYVDGVMISLIKANDEEFKRWN